MRLKLSEWASVAEIIGAIAVIVSLVYVGHQVNDNTSAIRSAAANDASVAMQTWYLEMGSNREASDLWFNAMTSPDPLPTHDEFQFMMMMHAVLLGMQNSYLLSQEGTIDPEFREAITTAIVACRGWVGTGVSEETSFTADLRNTSTASLRANPSKLWICTSGRTWLLETEPTLSNSIVNPDVLVAATALLSGLCT